MAPRVVVVGAGGQLGEAVAARFREQHPVVALARTARSTSPTRPPSAIGWPPSRPASW